MIMPISVSNIDSINIHIKQIPYDELDTSYGELAK